MPDGNKCPQCGTPLQAGALASLCPVCLLKQGAADETRPVSIAQFPSPANDETLAIRMDDNDPPGSDWYEFVVSW